VGRAEDRFAESFCDKPCVFGSWCVVEVAHGGFDVGVAYPALDASDVGVAMTRLRRRA
jgi:hypothetical protein